MKQREMEPTNMASNISVEDSQLGGDGQRVDTTWRAAAHFDY